MDEVYIEIGHVMRLTEDGFVNLVHDNMIEGGGCQKETTSEMTQKSGRY